MIYCHKCKAQNISNATLCSKCGTNLLPGIGIGKRIGKSVGFTVAGVFVGVCLYFWVSGVGIIEIVRSKNNIIILLAGALFSLTLIGMGILSAIDKTPAYERYLRRANRHIELDPKQSIEDYSMALELRPANFANLDYRFKILNERASIYNKLDMVNEAKQGWLEELWKVNKLLESETGSSKDVLLSGRANIRKKMGLKDESIL
ncbi:MAG: zinc ribbon domain-containing protein [Actinobacteria bacterium]|nr:zinc ribbon domain-containing protein [Actinomycetota bacterium]